MSESVIVVLKCRWGRGKGDKTIWDSMSLVGGRDWGWGSGGEGRGANHSKKCTKFLILLLSSLSFLLISQSVRALE